VSSVGRECGVPNDAFCPTVRTHARCDGLVPHDADPREHRRTAGRRDQTAGGSGGPVKRTAQPQRLIHPTADHASSRQLYSANAGGALVRFLSTYDQKETEHEITHLCGPRSIYNSGGRSFASCGLRLSLLPSRANVGISRQLPVYELSAVLGFSVWHRCILRYQSKGGVRTPRTSTLLSVCPKSS
jgi:hypothetical protein